MRKIKDAHIFQLSEKTILLSWKEEIGETLLSFLLTVKKRILTERKSKIVEVINTYDALLLKYSAAIADFNGEKETLQSLIENVEDEAKQTASLYRIPVCYDEKFGLDLSEMMQQKKLSKEEIIDLHTKPVYTVYFTGFLPGFPYLGGLSDALFMDRKQQPRKKIPEGAVGIGGRQTGIYPSTSPGGWQLIGNCPLSLFDSLAQPPCLFTAGDRIAFYPISIEEHQRIKKGVEAGRYQIKKETWK